MGKFSTNKKVKQIDFVKLGIENCRDIQISNTELSCTLKDFKRIMRSLYGNQPNNHF